MERVHLATEILAAGDLVGLLQSDPEDWFTGSADSDLSDKEIDKFLSERTEARKSGDYKLADKIRDDLAARGISMEDGPDGTKWRRT